MNVSNLFKYLVYFCL